MSKKIRPVSVHYSHPSDWTWKHELRRRVNGWRREHGIWRLSVTLTLVTIALGVWTR